MDRQLARQIESCKQDYSQVAGKEWHSFYCPILHIDEPADLCKGHVVPKALRTSNAWVPQRQDIDNFYGTIAEAEFASMWDVRDRRPLDILADRRMRQRHRPRIEHSGKAIDHYFSGGGATIPQGHTSVKLVDERSNTFADLVVKMTPEELLALEGSKLQLTIHRDFRASVIATVLKIAHLTMFRMLGYRYVLSAPGLYVGHILGEFFRSSVSKGGSPQNALDNYFARFACMMSPMAAVDSKAFHGTVDDHRLLACIGAKHGIYSIGVIVKAVNDYFCVFLPPDDGHRMETYLSFLKEPPSSIGVRIMQFQQASNDEESHWITSGEDPVRVLLP